SLVTLIESTAARFTELAPAVHARVSEVRATAALLAGDAGAYLELMAACARSLEEAGDLRSLCWCRINLGHAHMEIGAWADVEASALGRLEEGEAALGVVRAEVFHAAGRAEDARAAIRRARARVLERAERIERADYRRSFLGIPENERTLELAARWLDDG